MCVFQWHLSSNFYLFIFFGRLHSPFGAFRQSEESMSLMFTCKPHKNIKFCHRVRFRNMGWYFGTQKVRQPNISLISNSIWMMDLPFCTCIVLVYKMKDNSTVKPSFYDTTSSQLINSRLFFSSFHFFSCLCINKFIWMGFHYRWIAPIKLPYKLFITTAFFSFLISVSMKHFWWKTRRAHRTISL